MSPELPLIKIVGVSAAGKSTLVAHLRQRGYNARSSSQEHSQTPDMWQRIRPPALLIYLHADLETQAVRRPDVPWDEAWLQTERERLAHARQHADLEIDTRDLGIEEVMQRVIAFLRAKQIDHAGYPLPPVPITGGSYTQEDPTDTQDQA